ncbi:hypothetical protein BKA62DRAFT_696598 [Auriculariales sp. MPI-PUGE-AT-0066]|nr:hypothetical protein BKA62DRAFT_696598 [Auriculariales sp. MPI-PUGE-AT-0066]
MDILPDELRQDIFTHLVGFFQCFDLVSPSLLAFNEALRTPRWRALLLNSPELWAFAHARDDCPTDNALLRLCIERSGQHPLDVWIHSDLEFWNDSPGNSEHGEDDESNRPITFFEWLDLLQRNMHRWRRVRIDFPRPTPIDRFAMFTRPMPLLEQLVLSTPSTEFGENMVNTEWESDANSRHLYFQECPNLRSLTSHATVMTPAITLFKLEYLNLSIRGIEDDQPLWDALAMTPTLRELTIYYERFFEYSSEFKLPQSPRHMPTLRRLDLLGYSQYDQDLSKFLSAPNLETLTVSVDSCNQLGLTYASIGQTVCNVVMAAEEEHGMFMRSDALALDALQNVESLELRGIPPGSALGKIEDFFASLAGIGKWSHDPMPKWGRTLRKIVLRGCTIELEDCTSLAALVGVRMTEARDNADDAFELQSINTKLMKRMDYEIPESMAAVMHLLQPSIVEVKPEVSQLGAIGRHTRRRD